jgi:hypothetical protein
MLSDTPHPGLTISVLHFGGKVRKFGVWCCQDCISAHANVPGNAPGDDPRKEYAALVIAGESER